GLYASLLARQFSATLIVAHAFTLSQAAMEVEVDGTLLSRQRKDLNFLLSDQAAALASGSMAVIPILKDGDPIEVLPELADSYSPAMLVLGTHGGGWMQRKLIGSVAERVLRTSRWPTLTVGPEASPPRPDQPFQRILYATDLDPGNAAAAALALRMAEATAAEIDVLHVVEGGTDEESLNAGRERYARALGDVLPGKPDVFRNSEMLVAAGDVHEQILNHIKRRVIDLLILGIRKTSYWGIQTNSSGAFPLIVQAECPVLTITDGDAANSLLPGDR
ncbi:MAG: universal stress protein, partial [Acidobacteriaceae bacterium]